MASIAPPVVFVVGATATGKSSVAMKAARQIGGEIICADSQTLRKSLDIGTAKPSKKEQNEIPHHLIDVIEPYDRFSVAEFKRQANKAIEGIIARGKVPIVVGGTGLYINALYFNFEFEAEQDDLRKELESLSVKELQQKIERAGYNMPENSTNPRHLVGTLLRGGRSRSDTTPAPGAIIVGLKRTDDELKQRISDRVDKMFENGFLEEVKSVVTRYGPPPEKFDAIGYPIAYKCIQGELDESQAKTLFKRGDWQYARRQKMWFKRNENIVWFTDVSTATEYIVDQLS